MNYDQRRPVTILFACVLAIALGGDDALAQRASAYERATTHPGPCTQDSSESSVPLVGTPSSGKLLASPSMTTRALVAATDLLLDRARAELRSALLEEMIEILEPSKGPSAWKVAEAFPTLRATLAGETGASYLGPSAGPVLARAIRQDLDELPHNLIKVFPTKLAESTDLASLKRLLEFFVAIRRGTHPATALESWASLLESRADCAVLDFAVVELSIYSAGLLHSAGDERRWVSCREFDGLSREDIECISSLLKKDFETRLGALELEIPQGAEALSKRLRPLLIAMDAVTAAIEEKPSIEPALSLPAIIERQLQSDTRYLRAVFALLEASLSLDPAPDDTAKAALARVEARLHSLARLLEALHQRSYADVAPAVLRIVTDAAEHTRDVDTPAFPPTLRWLLTTAADLASADSSEAMRVAIDHAVLPRGSYRAKQDSDGEVYLNAYFGLALGSETLLDLEGANFDSGFNNLSVFAPVGIEYDMGGWTFFSSASLFLSVIDLGALANYRIRQTEGDVESADDEAQTEMDDGNAATTSTPDISLRQVLAPGAFLVASVAKKPIALGLGVQYLPHSRGIEFAEASADEGPTSDTRRVTFFVAIDIPIWRF